MIDEPRVGCRSLAFGEVRSVDQKRRQVRAVLSTAAIDSYGESVLPEALDLKRFNRNPVLVANHTYAGLDGSPGSVGRWIKLGVEKVRGVGEALVGTCEFMRDDELAKKWWQRYAQGVAVAFSVGFWCGLTSIGRWTPAGRSLPKCGCIPTWSCWR